jgi:pimeloyl-ACP methyl ester carboxylesterase
MAEIMRLRLLRQHVGAPAGEPSAAAAAAAAPGTGAMLDQVLVLPDGREVGYDDYGGPGVAVLCCHGGPGNRRQRLTGPETLATVARARELGLRLIGIDRPGYGLSTLEPGRTIASWAPTAVAVADHLGLARFMTMGISTGGSYALCIAALYPERVIAVVTGCAMTDMSHPAGERCVVTYSACTTPMLPDSWLCCQPIPRRARLHGGEPC